MRTFRTSCSLLICTLLFVNISWAETFGTSTMDDSYHPTITPADFVVTITNPYLPLPPGATFMYEGENDGEHERIEVQVTNDTKDILGVTCVVVSDKVWVNGELVEDTLDWYAQDQAGNVWYFGEDSKEIEDGEVVSTKGSWEAGVDGAMPGIVMPADPQIGASYRQEYYVGEAEDMADVLGLSDAMTVAFGAYENCLKTKEWTPLEPDVAEHKYYAPGIGLIAEEAILGGTGRIELVTITKGSRPHEISKELAKAIALKKVPGRVTDVETEKKFRRSCYVIQIDPDEGRETDVFISRETGEVLAVEE